MGPMYCKSASLSGSVTWLDEFERWPGISECVGWIVLYDVCSPMRKSSLTRRVGLENETGVNPQVQT
jgi:hypothetical protein